MNTPSKIPLPPQKAHTFCGFPIMAAPSYLLPYMEGVTGAILGHRTMQKLKDGSTDIVEHWTVYRGKDATSLKVRANVQSVIPIPSCNGLQLSATAVVQQETKDD